MKHVVQLKSEAASLTKSLRGAQAFIAVTSIKHEDDEHECNIKKGEKFYLKKLGKRHYLIDVEGKEMYQFSINAKQYAALSKKHKPFDDSAPTGRPGRVATGIGRGRDTSRKRPTSGPKAKPATNHKVSAQNVQSPETIKALKSAFKAGGLDVNVRANTKTPNTVITFKDGKPDLSAVIRSLENLSGSVSRSVYVKEVTSLQGGRKPRTLPKSVTTLHLLTKKPSLGLALGKVFKVSQKGVEELN